jgi:hypothetical protein
MRLVTSITNALPAVVTTTFDHGYTTGLIVRMNIPFACGMQQLDGFDAPITVTSTNTFTLNVDTTYFDTFSIPANPVPPWADTCAQVIPIGEVTSMISEAVQNTRP